MCPLNEPIARWKSDFKYFLRSWSFVKLEHYQQIKYLKKQSMKKLLLLHAAHPNKWKSEMKEPTKCRRTKYGQTFSLFSFVCSKQLPNRAINRWEYNDFYRTPFILCFSLRNIQWFGISVPMLAAAADDEFIPCSNFKDEKVKKSNENDDNEIKMVR